MNFRNLENSLPTAQGKGFRNNINTVHKTIGENSIYNNNRERPNNNSTIHYYSMLKMFLYSNVIEFKIHGDIERKAGEIIQINIPEGDEHHEKYVGYWYVLRVYHKFDKNNYYNFIQACRIDKKVVNTNKALFTQNTQG